MSATQPTLVQSLLHGYNRLSLSLMVRLSVIGRENIPEKGALLVVANHISTMDPVLLNAVLPDGARFVGPRDFKLLFPADLFVRWSRSILVNRSAQFERAALREMTDFLNAGGILVIFPEGGTWEKPITDAKPGAAYLSAITSAPILPVGIGGTYQVWRKVARLRRPRVTLNIGEVMAPVEIGDRTKRAEILDKATHDIMQCIYGLLPPEDQAWYDDQARRRYDLYVEVWRGDVPEMVDLPGRAVLGELMLKPNLLSPLVRNAGLPLDPLRYPGIRFLSGSVRLAARSLQHALNGPFADYMPYRLGEARTQELHRALAALHALAETPGVTGIVLKPTSRVE